MNYKKKIFHVENISTEKLSKKFNTPLYCYSYLKLKNNIVNFKNHFSNINPLICFSVKSNSNVKIIKEIKNLDCGADVVSKGEMMKALKAGVNPKKIVFSGVGKTYSELEYAINKNILLINVESKSELLVIEKIGKIKKKKVNIGIRLNPSTNAKTLKQISTGREGDKFGVTEKEFLKLVKYAKLSKFTKLKCLSVHIGSQILNHKPYEKMLKVIDRLIKKSNHRFEYIDLGGGMGISYKKNNKKFNFKNTKNLKRKIKNLIKKDKKKLKELESIIHPLVRKEMKALMKPRKNIKISIFEIPLLIESKLTKYFDVVIFVGAQVTVPPSNPPTLGTNPL